MYSRFKKAFLIFRYLGIQWILFRLYYWAKLRFGIVKVLMSQKNWEDVAKDVSYTCKIDNYVVFRRKLAVKFFPSLLSANFSDCLKHNAQLQADKIQDGIFTFFSLHEITVGNPPQWNTHPLTKQAVPADRHWSEIGDFGFGDIKWTWELSRFSWAYTLVRAYWQTQDEKYCEIFWQLLASWCKENPPNTGPQWKCGQEIALRIMALCFALSGFINAKTTTKKRVKQLCDLIYCSTHRIEKNIHYALSQKNNHGISEALGLWTVGLLFPEFTQSKRWLQIGEKWLVKQAAELIYADGAFSQHSFNYQRLMLQLYLWYLQLAKLNNLKIPAIIYKRVQRSYLFLLQLQDTSTGYMPNYGQNDGALILPLNDCDYRDFRPVLQALHYFYTQEKLYTAGPWDEDLFWLFGQEALGAKLSSVKKTELQAPIGGYHTLQGEDSWLFVRSVNKFKHRPSQADILHVDLWWRGLNIALDAGTYSYNAPEPWSNALTETRFHNVLHIAGKNQMQRVNRFLWLPWLQGSFSQIYLSPGGLIKYWYGEHDGYQKQTVKKLTRALILIDNQHWFIIDTANSDRVQPYELHYLLHDCPYEFDENKKQLMLKTSQGKYWIGISSPSTHVTSKLIRALETSADGWQSPYYHYKTPAISIRFSHRDKNTFFVSTFSEMPFEVKFNTNIISAQANDASWYLEIQVTDTGRVLEIMLKGSLTDQLNMEQ